VGSGSITAAIIFAAIISIATLIVGRGSKISELRQSWINDQRADFGKWAAAAFALARSQTATSRAADLNTLEEAAFRIRLRENPKKKEWAPVIDKMDAVRVRLLGAAAGTTIDIFDELKDIGDLAQLRLKKDWNKVRAGEWGYRITILFFPMLFGVLVLMGYYNIYPDRDPFLRNPETSPTQNVIPTQDLVAPPTDRPAPRR
jgi:hypothetical protein